MSHATLRRSQLTRCRINQVRCHRTAVLAEALESRTLLSSTLFVTPTVTTSNQFTTLQAALAFANDGDTVVLQPGFSAGTFATTVLNGSISAGSMFIRTVAALDLSEIVSIGAGTASDPVERDMVTSITKTLLGDYMVGLASPLQFDHDSSAVDATNPSTGGPSIGINKGVTLITDGNADMTLPFNVEVWAGTSGASISPHIFTPANPMPAPVTPASETIAVTAANLTTVQGGYNCGFVARFTDSVKHKASDFTATVTFADGSTVKGYVVRWFKGDFEVIAPHRFTTPGSTNFTVSVTSKAGGSGTGTGSVTVNPRTLTAQGVNVTTSSKVLACATVATFTDNLHCTWPQSYTATIVWSDGLTTTAVICRNWNGTMAVKATRNLPGPGTLTGTVTIATNDGTLSTTASFTLTINSPAPAPFSLPHGGDHR